MHRRDTSRGTMSGCVDLLGCLTQPNRLTHPASLGGERSVATGVPPESIHRLFR